MNPLAEVLRPINVMGPDVSAAVYRLPASLKPEQVNGLIDREPRLSALLDSGRAQVHGAYAPGSEGLLAVGGFLKPAEFREIHRLLMAVSGVEFVVGFGRGGESLRPGGAGRKSWWKFWK